MMSKIIEFHRNVTLIDMAHPEGFEPPTKWFEATYSIQLSYGCVTSAYFNYFLVNSQRLIFTAQEILSSEELRSIFLHL